MDKLDCVVQDYAWGDLAAIPKLLGVEPTGAPQAELWMGAHPKAPSTLPRGETLTDAIAADASSMLGSSVAERFGQLPYLFKVLSAGQPLSIQAHPSLAQAAAGFERENNAGIDVGAPNRTYRDANHKPEIICAITPFVAKCGFRPLAATRRLFDLFLGDSVSQLQERLAADGSDADVLAATLAWLLQLGERDAQALVAEVVASAQAARDDEFEPDLSWTPKIEEFFPGDIGVVVALLLNHVVLEPGDAVFLEAGNLHAYLSGTGMELMANSDNVVRGGLTPKHIDVDELLSVVDCTPIDAPVQRADSPVFTFEAAVPEFALTRYELTPTSDQTVRSTSADILIVASGSATVRSTDTDLELRQGEVAFIPAADSPYELAGDGTVFRAAVGDLSIGA